MRDLQKFIFGIILLSLLLLQACQLPGAGTAESELEDGDNSTASDQLLAFESTVYPILTNNCIGCHSGSGPGSPAFASSNSQASMNALINGGKVDLVNANNSRIYQKVGLENHNCWSNCSDNGNQILGAVQSWIALISSGSSSGGSSSGGSGGEGMSNSLTMADTQDGGGIPRIVDSQIAYWDFEEGTGDVANDSSGVGMPANLGLRRTTWVQGGLHIDSAQAGEGNAVATTASSQKVYNMIAGPNGSQEYSVECWQQPDDNMQDGPARIISYSEGTGGRNFLIGNQGEYTIHFRRRTNNTDANGVNPVVTDDNLEIYQEAKQHIMVTYSQAARGKIFVNGTLVSLADNVGGNLSTWQNNYRITLGNETTGDRLWQGTLYSCGIHNRAFGDGEVLTQYQAEDGVKQVLEFDMDQCGTAGAKVTIEIDQIDAFNYEFSAPQSSGTAPLNLSNGMLVVVNGTAPGAGQSFKFVTGTFAPGQEISPFAAYGPVTNPATDVFQLQCP